MAKLILSMDGLVLKEIPLSKERTTIGRKAHNDIQIDNLAVSGEHAVIVTILNDSFLEDLGSTNGTLVNGNPVKKHFLQNNDVIELGKYKLKFIQEAGAAAGGRGGGFREDDGAAPLGDEGGGRAGQGRGRGRRAGRAGRAPGARSRRPAPAAAGGRHRARSRRRAAAPAAAAARQPRPRRSPAPAAAPAAAPRPAQPLGAIQLLSGGNAGKELELAKPLTTLGKPGVQVAVLTRRPQGYFITHVEGAQRPTVNGQAIGTRAACAQGPRPGRDRRHQDGVLPQELIAGGWSPGPARPPEDRVKQHIVRIVLGLAITLFFIGHAARFYHVGVHHPARQHHLRRAPAADHARQGRRAHRHPRHRREEPAARSARWPWSRNMMARLMDKLFDKYGVAHRRLRRGLRRARRPAPGMQVLDAAGARAN